MTKQSLKNAYMDYFERLRGVDPRLITVMVRAARRFHKAYPAHTIRITEGLRTLTRQSQLVDEGKSWTMKSQHLLGRAVDVAIMVEGQPLWDVFMYEKLNRAVQTEADDLGVTVQWGGDWDQVDAVHFELVLFKGKNLT